MIELSRTVRFCLNGPGETNAPARHNNFSAYPPMRGLGRYYEMQIHCCGEVDPVTGYFINIKHIDQAFRQHALPYLQSLITEDHSADLPMGHVMQQLLGQLHKALDGMVQFVRLQLTPYHCLEIRSSEMDRVTVRQQFEFSAAHRLHVPQLDAQQNRDVFGKCNNPSGHGHNYRVEVAVRDDVSDSGQVVVVEKIDELVDRVVIEKLDHKHLNVDVPEFADLNPSVENIARVIYQMLRDPLKQELGLTLREISVWETSKTVSTYSED